MFIKAFARFFFIAIFLIILARIPCDSKTTDSLIAILKSMPEDTAKVQVLAELAYQLISVNAQEALIRSRQAIELAEKLNFTAGKAKGYSRLALAYKLLTKYDSSFFYFRKSSSLFASIGRTEGQIAALINIGTLYNRIGLFDSAAYYLFRSLELAELIKDTALQASTLNGIGLLMIDQNKTDEAIAYFLRALDINEKSGNKKGIAMNSENLGSCYLKKKNYAATRKYYDQTMEIYRFLEDKRSQARININMSQLLREEKKYEEAIAAALFAARLYEQTKNPNGTLHAFLSLSEINSEIKNYSGAAKYALQALDIARETGNHQLELDCYRMLNKTYFMKGDFKLAYEYLQKASSLNDSLFNEKKESIVSELQTKYETEKKEKEIHILNKDNEIKNIALKKQQVLRNSIIGGAVLIIIIGLLLFNHYRTSQKQKQQAERMRISNDLHDEVGSTLSSISMISSYAAGKISENNTGDAQKLVEEISSSALQMGDDMNDIIWAINPRNDSFESILNRLKNYAARITESKNIVLHFSSNELLSKENLSMDVRKNIYLICKEAINNAVKYSDCKNLFVAFQKNKNNLNIAVQDDGKGFDVQNSFEGNGLKNINARSLQSGGKIFLKSEVGKGTELNFEMKFS